MADNQDELIQSFCSITGTDPQTGRHLLEASNWDLQNAASRYFESNDEDMEQHGSDEDDVDEAEHTPLPSAAIPSSSAASRPQQSSAARGGPARRSTPSMGRARVRTLGDLGAADNDEEDEDDNPKKRDLFAGGEKSGLAVQDPGDPNARSGANLIQDILKRAAEGGQRRRQEEESAAPAPRFTGSGHTLGSDSTPSVTVGSPTAPEPETLPPVTRTLTFWRNGFSVEDGPLMRYDDPANREILQGIERGRAPLSLMNVQPGQPADVNVFKRMDEDYIPPKKKFVPFSGQGQRLGSLTPGESLSTPAAAPATPLAAPPAAPSSVQPAAPTVSVDMSAPNTSLQIRLGDGTRLVSRFNHTHTVGDIYAFVNASSIGSRSRAYVLQTTFPNKELMDHAQTLKEAGLLNALVVQKWTS
ncbi:hypothetical protein FN846DRAFT_949148 [Sphaerosporella brunnea]|uniref:SEP-domain-containing protein n=1 Tax=Sphaerosporella brunnea TaxID=1250544 RepID=A0A5J5EX33_9PEZI|nr:hypothetical protein FN846DRAFT_949148 [Sphaerosporella brunnea]